jgi:hypothetical protein
VCGGEVQCGLGLPTIESLGQYRCKTSVLNKLNLPPGWRIGLQGGRYSNSQ